MTQLNLYAAKVISKYFKYVKASTDVTGFGIIGHSDNLVQIQKENVDFHFDFLPVYGGLQGLDNLRRKYKIRQGLDPETSGGLLIVLDRKIVGEFQKTFRGDFGMESWIVGRVVKGNKQSTLDPQTHFETV